MQLVEVSDFAGRSPPQIAGTSLSQICTGNRLETTPGIEASGQLVGDRLIVDKAVVSRRADGLFVELLGLKYVAFDPGNLRAYQGGAILEVFRAIRLPYPELAVVIGQSIDMFLALDSGGVVAKYGARKRGIKMKLRV